MDPQPGNRIRSRLPGRGSLADGDRTPKGVGDRTSRFQAASYPVLMVFQTLSSISVLRILVKLVSKHGKEHAKKRRFRSTRTTVFFVSYDSPTAFRIVLGWWPCTGCSLIEFHPAGPSDTRKPCRNTPYHQVHPLHCTRNQIMQFTVR